MQTVRWITGFGLVLLAISGGCEEQPTAPEPPTPSTTVPPAGKSACDWPTDMPKIEPPSDRAKAEDLAAAANARGATLMIAGNAMGALEEFRKVQLLVPDRIEGFVNEAIVYAHHGSPACQDVAAAQFESILQKDPNQPHALYGKAILIGQGMTASDPEEELEMARRFLEAVPDDAYSLYLVGKALRNLDRPAEALDYFKRCIEVDPEFIPGHQAYGTQLLRLERDDPKMVKNAEHHLKTVERLNEIGKSARFWGERYTEHGLHAQAMPLFGLTETAQIAASDQPVTLEDVTDSSGMTISDQSLETPAAVVWFDFDNDGYPDLLICGGMADGQPQATRLFRNNGPADQSRPFQFTDVTPRMGLGDRSRFRGLGS